MGSSWARSSERDPANHPRAGTPPPFSLSLHTIALPPLPDATQLMLLPPTPPKAASLVLLLPPLGPSFVTPAHNCSPPPVPAALYCTIRRSPLTSRSSRLVPLLCPDTHCTARKQQLLLPDEDGDATLASCLARLGLVASHHSFYAHSLLDKSSTAFASQQLPP